MNQSYRLVWSARHGGLVAVAEHTRCRTKGGRTASALVTAVAGAVAVLTGGQAFAANLCTTASTTVSTAQGAGDNCTLGTNGSLVVGSGGVINPGINTNAVIVNGATVGSITNGGTLTGAHGNSNNTGAVSINGTVSGDFTNQAGGLIRRTGDGSGGGAVIEFDTAAALTGSFINQAGGHLQSDQYGVLIRDNSVIGGGLTNAGTITSGDGFNVLGGTSIGGSVVNTATGLMDVQWGGIELSSVSVAGSVRNDGTISVAGGSSGVGIGVSGSVAGDVINTGLISVGGANTGMGLDVSDLTVQGTVSNSGTISVAGTYAGTAGELRSGIHASDSTIAGGIVNSGTVIGGDAGVDLGENLQSNLVNQASGSISGAVGVRVGIQPNFHYYTSDGFTPPTAATVTGSITNQGHIQGTTGAGLALLGAALTGNITNAAGATISGATAGIEIAPGHWTAVGITSSSSSVTSTGSVNSSVTGGVTNSGLIQGTNGAGIHVNQATVGGSIVNLLGGSIAGNMGILVEGGSLIEGGITNAGTITGVSRDAIHVDHGTVAGGITNTGLLQGESGIYLQNAHVDGGLHNSGSIAGGSNGIYVDTSTVSGGVSNSGTISVTTSNGGQAPINIRSSTITGDLHNTGFLSISADSDSAYGVALRSSTLNGSIINSGTIEAVAPGWSSGIGLNLNNSTISGGITNSGLIHGGNFSTETGYGIHLDNTSVAGSIVNSGTIVGVGSSAGYGVALSSATVGSITNTGDIHGDSKGLSLEGSTITGGIVNGVGGTISAGDTALYVDPNSVVTEGISNAGLITAENKAVSLQNGTTQITLNNTGTIQGEVDLGSMGNTLNLNGGHARVIGDVSSTSLSGTVNINGDFTSEGTFLLRYLNVNNGAVFTMNHDVTVLTTTVANGATLDVGAGNRVVNFGDYVQNGTLRLTLNNASAYGTLTVGGNVTLNNTSVIDVRLNGTPGTRINGVIVAGSGGSGTLTNNGITVVDNSLLYNFTTDTTRNAQELDLISTPDTQGLTNAAVRTGNPGTTGVAGALQSMFNTSIPTGMQPVFTALNALPPGEINGALSQMLPSVQGAGSQAGVSALHSMNKIIQARIESNQGLSSGNPAAERYMWVRGFGSWAEQDDHKGVTGFDSNTSGLVVGGDLPVNDKVRAGGAFTYAKSDIDSKSTAAPSNVKVDTYELVGYGSYNIDPRTDVNVQVDVGQNRAKSNRLVFGGGTASADFDSLAYHVSAGIGRLFPVSEATNLTPSVRLDYTHMKTDGYTETGAALGGANLSVGDSTFKELLLTTDVKFSHQLNDAVKVVGNVTAGYDFLSKQLLTTSSFVGGGPTFTTAGLDVSPWLYRAGLGLIHDAKKGLEYSLRYDMEGRTSGYLNQTVSARVRWQF